MVHADHSLRDPPLVSVTATSLNSTPHVRLACFGSLQLPTYLCNHASMFSGFSTTHHREGPSLSGRSTELPLIVRGCGHSFYHYLVSAGRGSATDVIGQITAGLIVVKPALLGPVEVQPYVPFGQASPLIPHSRSNGESGAGDSSGRTQAGYRDATSAVASGLAGAGTFRPRDPDRGPTRTPPAVPPPPSRHEVTSLCGLRRSGTSKTA
jgi:hypothetical protein